MADLRESADLQQLESVGFFSVDGPFSTTTASNFRFPSDFSKLLNRTVEVESRLTRFNKLIFYFSIEHFGL
jgi:hypothetical protein